MAKTCRQMEDEFRALFTETSRALLGYALRRVKDPADAADVVAETFLVAWRRMDDVPNGNEARLWLFGVARRVLSNQQRGEHRRSNLSDRLRGELSGVVIDDPSDDLDTVYTVNLALARLDPDDAELLRLVNWEGFTPAEVAVILQISPTAVRGRIHRARSRLRVHLEDLGWNDKRSDDVGHVHDDEEILVRNRRCES